MSAILSDIKTNSKQEAKKQEQKCLRKGKKEGGVFDVAAGCTALYCNMVKTAIPRLAQQGY